MCADAPDNSGINAAAQANAEIARESLDWYKQIYAEQAPLRQEAQDRAFAVSDAQLQSMRTNDRISNEYNEYQNRVFRPLEERIVGEASNYDTEARKTAEIGKAMADVSQQSDMARQSQVRDMQRMGINPNDGKFAAMSNQMAMAEALGKAQAGNSARDRVELQGYARKMDAANLGRGLASNQATSAGVALNAGNSAANTGQMPMSQAQSAAGLMGQGFNTAIQGNQSAGNLYGQSAQLEAQSSGGLMGDLASIGSSAVKLYRMSDKNKKKNIKKIDDEKALESIEKTEVSSWDYKDGEGDGGRHVGAMAQDVQKNMGDKAAPGGKVIDLITMNGVTMAGLAALSKKVKRIEKKMEGVAA